MGGILERNEQNPRSENGLSRWTIVGSLALHLAFWTMISFIGPAEPPVFETIEMEVLTEAPPQAALPQEQTPAAQVEHVKKTVPVRERQVVDQDDHQINDEVDEKTRFLGKHNQRVLKQTVARDSGEFKNVREKTGAPAPPVQIAKNTRLNLQPKFDLTQTIHERDERERAAEESTETLTPKVNLETTRTPAEDKPQHKKPDQGTGEGGERSQTLDYIRDLEPGLETALSTKEFVFHGFYSRIRRQLEQHWAPNVRRKVHEMHRKGRSIASNEDKITKCLVTLDLRGNILRIQVIGDSGLVELDEAAVDAFRSAAPFPNPPTGMVDPDGTIKILWDFVLEA